MTKTSLKNRIWTIGHSTRSMAEFLEILESYKIQKLIDVRRFPGSRKFPHFKKENLEIFLPEQGIMYIHLENLGGRRKVIENSQNTAWRLASFQGYADYMETEDFKISVEKLQNAAKENRVAYMCAEAVWWSCHRSLISDYLKLRSWEVNHIMGSNNVMEHPFTKAAKIKDGILSYKKE